MKGIATGLVLGALAAGLLLAQQTHKSGYVATVLHDNEPLVGMVGPALRDDPPNKTFRLLDVPSPFASLQLFSDGRYLVQGIDYHIDAQGYVDIVEHAPLHTLVAFYRSEAR